MSLTSYVGLLAGAATLSIAGAGWSEMNTSEDAMSARIAALESEIQALKGSQGDQWLTEQRASEIRGLVQDVLADADTRASLLQSGMTGGWDKGFFLSSADGNYKLKISGWLQTRFVYNYQDQETGADPADRHRSGFENTRTRLVFDGHVVNPNWKYKVSGDFGRGSEGDPSGSAGLDLKDAYITHVCNDQFSVTAGQFKDPFLRETMVSSTRQLAVDRSIVDRAFTNDRVQGVMVTWKAGDAFKVYGTFTDGARSEDTTWETYDNETGAATLRAEWMAAGNWDQFEDFTSWQGDPFGFLLGAAFHYEKDEFGTTAGPEVETWEFTVDASVEFGGANLYGAFIYQNSDADAGSDTDNWGFVVQGGFFLAQDWELFGRFEWLDSDAYTGDELAILTVGVNKYFAKHAVKWSTDVGWSFNEVVDGNTLGTSVESLGWRNDAASDDDGEVVLRTQLQLMF
jgi:hypothetical protein